MDTRFLPELDELRSDEVMVLCLPHAGGGASFFRSWKQQFFRPYHICPVQLPGREERFTEKPMESVEEVVDAILPLILPRENPLVLFGHSMGTKLVYELERRLEAHGRVAELAIVSACAPPDWKEEHPIGGLEDAAFVEALLAYDGIPPIYLEHRELLEMFLPMLKADFRLSEGYDCGELTPLQCPIFAMGADRDYDAMERAIQDWKKCTTAEFDYQMFEGGHFYIKEQEADVCSLIRDKLNTYNPLVSRFAI